MLSDVEISEIVEQTDMISPFIQNQVSSGVLSFGLSPYGYDARLADTVKICSNTHATVIDPKEFDDRAFHTIKGDKCTIPPNGFLLGRTVEYVKMPRNMIGLCFGKSTYSRCGIFVHTTVLQPEWEGHVVIEMSNTTPLPAAVYTNEGICQFVFLRADGEVCSSSYADLKGKYMKQRGIVLPKVDQEETI